MAPKKILQLAPKIVPVRFNVSWISTPSSTKENSAEALSALEVYRHQNGVVQSLAGTKNVKRQRAKSMFVERSHSQSVKFSMDDMHHEFTARYNSPNRGLKSNADRQLAEAQPQPLSDCQKIYNELKARLLAKRAPVPPPLPPNQQQKLSWNELKALVPKQFPLVQGYVKPRPTFEWPMVVEMKGSAFYKMNEAMKKVIEYVYIQSRDCTFRFCSFTPMIMSVIISFLFFFNFLRNIGKR